MNLETKEKAHTTGRGLMCPNDAWVIVRNSELVAGRLGKATLGGGNKAGLFQVWPSAHRCLQPFNPVMPLAPLRAVPCVRACCCSRLSYLHAITCLHGL